MGAVDRAATPAAGRREHARRWSLSASALHTPTCRAPRGARRSAQRTMAAGTNLPPPPSCSATMRPCPAGAGGWRTSERMTATDERRAEKRAQSLNGYERTPRALIERFVAEELWRRPRYAWHRLWGDINPFPRTMRQVWDFAAGDADYAAHMVNGSPDEATLRRTGAKMAERLMTALQIDPTHSVLDLGPGVARVGR